MALMVLHPESRVAKKRIRKGKTAPFGVNSMRSQVLYRAAQAKVASRVAYGCSCCEVNSHKAGKIESS